MIEEIKALIDNAPVKNISEPDESDIVKITIQCTEKFARELLKNNKDPYWEKHLNG